MAQRNDGWGWGKLLALGVGAAAAGVAAAVVIRNNEVRREQAQAHGRNYDPHLRRRRNQVIAIDCEFVEDMHKRNMLGRVSIVNSNLDVLYDEFVQPTGPVKDFRTWISGVTEEDMLNGVPFAVAVQKVKEFFDNADVIVGHDIVRDLDALRLDFHALEDKIFDTSKKIKINGAKASLKRLTMLHLGYDIQEDEHDSVEDAVACMRLYQFTIINQ